MDNSLLKQVLKEYDEIVYIPMSSALSKSYESAARLAETEYNGKVFVVDNKIYIELNDKIEGLFTGLINVSIFDINSSYVGYIEA